MTSNVLRQCPTLKQLHNEIDVIIVKCNVHEPHYILMSSILHLTQIAQSRYLTTQKVPSHLVIDLRQVDRLNGHFLRRIVVLNTEVYIARTPLPEKLVIEDRVDLIQLSRLRFLHASVPIMYITDLERNKFM